jgi:peroxiredoxin
MRNGPHPKWGPFVLHWERIVLQTLIAAVIGAVLFFPQAQAAEEVCQSPGKAANLNFMVKDIVGKDVALNSFKGEVVLLDFWATWCPPCRKEIPGFIELYKTYQSRGFVVVGVSVDDSTKDVKKFVEKYRVNYPVLDGHLRLDLQKAFGPMLGFPTTFLINRDGNICFSHTGFTPLEDFERRIKALL